MTWAVGFFVEEDIIFPGGNQLQYPTYGKENLSSQNVLGGDMLVPRNISGS